MELRGLILLTALACSVRAVADVTFTDCKAFPAGVTGDLSRGDDSTRLEAVEDGGRSATVTLHGDLKAFAITAWDSATKSAMAKGVFLVEAQFNTAAQETKCGDMEKAAVLNKTPMPKMASVAAKWTAAPDFTGKVKFMALVVGENSKLYNLTSSEISIKAANKDSAGMENEGKKTETTTTAAASYTGLSTWLVIVALGLVAVSGHRLHRPIY